MGSSLDRLLFAVLPYVAVAAFLILLLARRFRFPPFGTPVPAAPQVEGSRPGRERFLIGCGLFAILSGHFIGFLIPEQVLLWNNDSLRRYVLEVSALVFALLTLAGLLLLLGRFLFSAEGRQGIGPSDWVLWVLLLLQVGNGIVVALFYPWGSAWYATSVVPYLRSLFQFDPDLSAISAMPHAVKLHVVSAWVLVMVLPCTRVVRPLLASDAEPGEVRRQGRAMTFVLLVGLAFSLLALVPRLWGLYLPGNQQGYEPAQPIAFSHQKHGGELQISCLYCHGNAEKSRHAGIPSASVCMNCHRFVTAPMRDLDAETELAKVEKRPPRTLISPELAKLYAALALDDKLQPDPKQDPTPIRWVKVHNLPAFARFDHRAHVNAEVACQHCHGPVEKMERVRQVENLSMGWCVQCHRDANEHGVAGKEVHPSNDCTNCHH